MLLKNQSNSNSRPKISLFVLFAGCLLLVLGTLFYPSLDPGELVFSNDSPLGCLSAEWLRPPAAFGGLWLDLNSIGFNAGTMPISPSYLALGLLGPLLYSKFFVPIAIGFLGFSACFCFRRMGLGRTACVLGGLAAALNSGFFSAACWGVIPQTVAFGLDFLAVALLSGSNGRHPRISLVLAGLAVGLNVMEASDIGALFSVLIAAFVIYRSISMASDWREGMVPAVVRTSVVAVFALFMAAQSIWFVFTTQVRGVAGMRQDAESKARRWEQATQWSLPKRETLSLFVPGLYGYRMDTPMVQAHFPEWFDGGVYWGAMGRDDAWQRYFDSSRQGGPPDPNIFFLRQTGGGNYAGVLVLFLALWASFQAFRKKDSVFPLEQRKLIWFWGGSLVVALLLAFGHYAPFYAILYALPGSSTMRNPTKFLQIVDFALVILFAYGVDGLCRKYLEVQQPAAGKGAPSRGWWARASQFDRRWMVGSVMAVVLALIGWAAYSSHRAALEQYLQGVQFDELLSQTIASFSITQAAWFVLLLALAAVLVAAILGGHFSGKRARWGAILLGTLLLVDLGRADLPWVVYVNYKQKYATNGVIDFLREKPWGQRVSITPGWIPKAFQQLPREALAQLLSQQDHLGYLYRIEWAQHHFLYYNIQSLDVVQMPRPTEELMAYNGALQFTGRPEDLHLFTREWELTNTRYLLGPTSELELLNQLDQSKGRFRVALTFNIVPKPGITNATTYEELTAEITPNGPFALFEFTGALPRASLYKTWQVSTDDLATLKELASASFNPSQTLLVDSPIGAPPAITGTNVSGGTVEYKSYAPKHIRLEARADAPSVLLLNDKFDDKGWTVSVDGKSAPLLRCNYIMRGVQVPAGDHEVEFRFQPVEVTFYVSFGTWVLGLALLGFLAVPKREEKPVHAEPRPAAVAATK